MDMYSEKVRLANLYLYHVLASVGGLKVINDKGYDEEPNEYIMRFLESEANILEKDCMGFRERIAEQVKIGRMDLAYEKLGFIFEFMVTCENDVIKGWFSMYPHVLKGICDARNVQL